MNHIAIKLAVFLLLGAVVNVGVAWGCVWFVPLTSLPDTVVAQPPEARSGIIRWEQSIQRSFGRTRTNWATIAYWELPRGEHAEAVEQRYGRVETLVNGDVIPDRFGSMELAGWPFRSLSCHNTHYAQRWNGSGYETLGRARDGDVEGGISISSEPVRRTRGRARNWRALPYLPLFPGFAINTAFYAVILWAMWSAPFVTRRLIRKRLGKCLRCGYDLTGTEHDVCPECGAGRSGIMMQSDAEGAVTARSKGQAP